MKIRQYIKRMAFFTLMTSILAFFQETWGQVKGDKYDNTYREVKIQHKPAKWHGMRSGGNFVDTFDDTQYFVSGDGTTPIQATHTYVDTLYVRKGSPVKLWLPTLSRTKDENSAQYYQRWYNYLTEGTFATGLTGNDNVNDILTLHGMKYGNNAFYTTFYRLQNGYVAGNRGLIDTRSFTSGADFYYPSDDEYEEYTGLKNGSAGNDYYIVGCDLSGYMDEDKTTFTETTLGLRVLYYIVGIDDSWGTKQYANQYERLNTEDYQGGGNEANSKYLEEYEITFPCNHIGNFTNELVSIARQAQFYRIPGDDISHKLKATLATGTDVLKLVNNGVRNQYSHELYDTNTANKDGTLTLGDESRAIFFRKNDGSGNNTPWSVPDGTTATILVTKTVGSTIYNIARFKLTFKKGIRLLTQHQIDRLDDAREINTTISEDWFDESYWYRTPAYLDENYTLLTSRTFDYDPNVPGAGEITNVHQEEYYPYPLAWDFSSYLFYDGASQFLFNSYSTGFPYYDANPEWGSYAIVKDYMGYGDKADRSYPVDGSLGGRNADGYFLYVDASDLPGKLITLPFTQNLCAGSELLVSAWVKSAGQVDVEDAAMLFSIYGIEYGSDGSKNRTLIHAQSTGQIRRTTHIGTDAGDEYTNANGYGVGQNDWFQVVLSFLNNDPNVTNFDEYEVQIDNNSGSTAGGDFYLDEIKVYISKPLAEVTQLQTACSTGRTLMNLNLDWDRLMARVGGENTNTTHNLAICFVDTLIFHNEYNNGKNIESAIEAAAVDLGQEGNSYHFRVLNYNTNFSSNENYTKDKEEGNLAVDNGDAFYGYTAPDKTRSLSVDFYGAMIPGRTYWVVLVPDVSDDDISQIEINGKSINIVEADVFSGFYGDPCAINADFKVMGDVIIKVDGQIVTPETEFCRGNINNFTVDLQIPDLSTTDPNDMISITEGIYFDWFFGEANGGEIADPMTQYTEKVSMATGKPVKDENGISLQEALVAFRNLYPEVSTLSETDTPTSEGKGFTEEMYKLINYYVNLNPPAGVQNRPLVLHQSALNITLLEVLRIIVQPIPMSIGMDNLPDGYDEVEWASLCWGYTYLELITTNAAPTVYPGFNTVAYPNDLTGQSLRIGLDQITSVNLGNVDNNTLTVDLRDAKSFKTIDPDNPNKDFTLQLVGGNTNPNLDYNKLYLTDTNDPNMKRFIEKQGTSFDNHSLPIGEVKYFEAHYYGEGSTGKVNKMEVQFILDQQKVFINGNYEDFTFLPQEGYYYTFNVYFEEKADDGPTACYGRFSLTMKVVPEYLVWNDTQKTDTYIGNWNYDGNWQRIASTRIHAKKDGNSDYFTDGTNTTSNAFVPMLFSKVVIPAKSKIKLYQAGYGDNGKWNNDDRPVDVADPTQNIQYDLMAFESGSPLKTERYRVSLLDQIHFEPGAQMLHVEQLIYNKAWTDVEITPGLWTAVSTPLQDVVAGDWYAPTVNGRQETEYFKDITFNTTDYNRLNPAVYQRSWSTGANIIVENGGGITPVSFTTEWSSAYNDASVPYVAGGGFSIKGILNQGQQPSSAGKLLFRFPKADTNYDVSIGTLNRDNAGKLLVSNMVDRSDPYKYNHSDKVTVTLTPSADGKYLMVGNPFMAPLDVQAFVAANSDVLLQKYWISSDLTTEAVTYDGTNHSWSDETYFAAPYSVFYVQVAEGVSPNEEGKFSVVFKADMQKFAASSTGESSQVAPLRITAENDFGVSRATLSCSESANNAYRTAEDAELIQNLDGNNSQIPSVYTVAGDRAVSANQVNDAHSIPLGVFATDGSEVTITFNGTEALGGHVSLYDAEQKTTTPLYDGYSVTVNGPSHGRFLILTDETTDIDTQAVEDLTAYSIVRNQVIITSQTHLDEISIWSADGTLIRKVQPDGNSCIVDGIASGVVVLKMNGLTKKVLVK